MTQQQQNWLAAKIGTRVYCYQPDRNGNITHDNFLVGVLLRFNSADAMMAVDVIHRINNGNPVDNATGVFVLPVDRIIGCPN